MGAIETADTRPYVSLEEIRELEATLSAISTLQLQAFVNTYRIFPGGEVDTATPVTSTASLLTDTDATRGSYGDTAYFESHPQLCKHYRKVHSEAILADGKAKVLITKSILVTLDIFLLAGGHVRGDIWLDLMPMACRQLIVGAPELIVFYGDVVREHLLFHKPAFTFA